MGVVRFDSFGAVLAACDERGLPIWRVALAEQAAHM